jgi:beta,beta-carotene 9',10'-dioxygenase
VTATGTLTRFGVSLRGGKEIGHERLAEAAIELPRIHYRNRSGRPYRYVYGAANAMPGNFIDALVKVDVERHHHILWYADGCYPGEPVFVPAPEARREDDGVVLFHG